MIIYEFTVYLMDKFTVSFIKLDVLAKHVMSLNSKFSNYTINSVET